MKLLVLTSGNISCFSKVTAPLEESLYKFEVESPPLFTKVGSSATKNPKSVVLVETSSENEAKGDKSKVEVKREPKSFFVSF